MSVSVILSDGRQLSLLPPDRSDLLPTDQYRLFFVERRRGAERRSRAAV